MIISFLIIALQTLAVWENIVFINVISAICQFTLLFSEVFLSITFHNLTVLSSDVEQISREYGQ